MSELADRLEAELRGEIFGTQETPLTADEWRTIIAALRCAPPEALRSTNELKKAIGLVLLRIVQDYNPYKTQDGFTRWGRIQEDINAEIDKTFPSPQLEK